MKIDDNDAKKYLKRLLLDFVEELIFAHEDENLDDFIDDWLEEYLDV
jgi:hypothetical protein